MRTACFLDASVIADWLILKLALDSRKDIDDKKELLLKRERDNPFLFYAYKLLEDIKLNSIEEFRFLTSSLAISEVISVIHDKLCIDKMYELGIPLKYWYKYKDKIKLEKGEMLRLSHEIIRLYLLFVVKKRIKLAENPTLQNTIYLISLHRETHDSFLVSQAVRYRAKYFVSRDRRLKDSLSSYNKIKVCDPKEFYINIFKQKRSEVIIS